MSSRRLILAGGGSFGDASGGPPVALTASPEGGWAIPSPSAYEHNDRTYVGWVDSTGHIKIGVFDSTSGASLMTPIVVRNSAADLHNNPSILVDSVSHRLVVAYCDHVDIRMRVRVSVTSLDTDPLLADGFGGEWHGADAPINTYAMLVQLRGISGAPIYLFTRDLPDTSLPTTTRFGYWVSTDLFATDPPYVRLFTAGTGLRSYWEIASDWDTRIDVFACQGTPGVDATVPLRHFYIDGTNGHYNKSDGTQITASLPFATTDMTLVDASAGGSISPNGSAAYDADGPALVYFVLSGGDNAVWTARWRSGAWQLNEVVASVGGVVTGNNYASGCAMDPFDSTRVWVGAKVGSHFELFRFRTGDDGATWSTRQLTDGSAIDYLFVEPVHFATGLRVTCLAGTYTSDVDYAFGIVGAAG